MAGCGAVYLKSKKSILLIGGGKGRMDDEEIDVRCISRDNGDLGRDSWMVVKK